MTTVERRTKTRTCACSACFDHRNGRRRSTRCGRVVTIVVWDVVSDGRVLATYNRRRDAVAVVREMRKP